MIATINTERAPFNSNFRKEKNFHTQYTGLAILGGINGIPTVKEAVTLRLYYTDSRAYCCVWLQGGVQVGGYNLWQKGSAYAGGYGYHRGSAAAACALRNAGVKLSESIDGCGDSAIRNAVEAVTRALYPAAVCIHVSDAHA